MASLITLAEASARTGESVRHLRQWCATGQLACEKDGRGWMVRESDLQRIAQLTAHRRQHRGRPLVLVVPAEAPLEVDLASEVARRLGLSRAAVAMSTLVIDGQEYTVAVWKDSNGTGGLEEIASLAAELGGDLLDGAVKAE